MGNGIVESGLFRSEQYVLEQRTTDPVDPDPNEEWLRVDIKPTYEDANGTTQTGVAEYRVANADGSVDTAPVAALGDAVGSNVIDKRRVYIDAGGSPTGKGFVPYATQGATYAKRKLEHPTDGRVAMHDALTASAIPDSVVLKPESNDLDNFGGDTAGFDINSNSPVFDGSLSIKYSQSTETRFIGSISGLANYPRIGATHSFFINPQFTTGPTDAQARVFFGHDSESSMGNGYAALIDESNRRFSFFRIDSGGFTNLVEETGVVIDDWMAVDVLHESDGTLTGKLYDASSQTADTYREGTQLSEISVSDSTHLTGGQYDAQGVGLGSVRNTQEVLDLWRTE